MKTTFERIKIPANQWRTLLTLVVLGLLTTWRASAVGTWIPVTFPPYITPGHMLLLSDGSVMVQKNADKAWYRLSPDNRGHYANGIWTNFASMHDTRLYYSSDVLPDGRVFVAGGEYGTGKSTTEIFNPLDNAGKGSWTYLNPPSLVFDASTEQFLDSDSMVLANGNVLVAPVNVVTHSSTVIYDPRANSWTSSSADRLHWQEEATWVKLPDDSILTVDIQETGGLTSERYVPSLNAWLLDANLPVSMAGGVSEVGGALMLPDGRAFFLGGSGHTAFYTPSGNTNKGSWLQGPDMPHLSISFQSDPCSHAQWSYDDLLTAQDTPAAMMVNGKILCQLSRNIYHTPVWFYEYDPSVNSFVPTSSPNDATPGSLFCPAAANTDGTSMLQLPDGNILYNDGGGLYIYQPDSGPIASGKPGISSVSWNGNGSLHLTGKLFNGISQGVSYGDDAQMDSNYPLVRLTDGGGNVVYARTYNWSSAGVATGNRTVTTEAALPADIHDAPGTYSLRVIANGNASDPVTFYGPVWIDFTTNLPIENGSYSLPFSTFAQGTNAVSPGGTIAIKGPGIDATLGPAVSRGTMTIREPMTITTIGGQATFVQ